VGSLFQAGAKERGVRAKEAQSAGPAGSDTDPPRSSTSCRLDLSALARLSFSTRETSLDRLIMVTAPFGLWFASSSWSLCLVPAQMHRSGDST